MKKLERSVRGALKSYGPALRNGHYGIPEIPGLFSGSVGVVPDDYGVISRVCCDVENGCVTEIRVYTYGDAMERRDYYAESTDITGPFYDYLGNNIDTWDDLISAIVREIENG